MDIYRKIWDADMKCNGIPPISINKNGDKSKGYVIVDTENCTPERRILKEVIIPDKKRNSYQLVEKLFDNYRLNQRYKENNTPSEAKEIEEFLMMAIDSQPIKVAKDFIEKNLIIKFTHEQWYTYLYDLWFKQFKWDSGIDLSGFEHVFIGEQRQRKLIGHHFWYKYWLEDNPDLNKHHMDQIELEYENSIEQKSVNPYVVTAAYYLNAYDNEKKRFIKIFKHRCAFFVGISAEGLLALGTVCALEDANVSENFIINNKTFKLELFKSPDGKSIRTFYPIYMPS